jgi:membrane fusion protein (multidrug efflux system)
MSSPTFRRRVTAVSILGLGAVVGGYFLLVPQKECKADPPAQTKGAAASQEVPVEVLLIKSESFELPVPATGTLVPQESVTLVSELSRRLTKIRAEEGTAVKKGDVLFELDSSDLAAERKRLTVQLSLAERNAARQKELLKESVTSLSEADAAQTAEQEILAEKQILEVSIAKTFIRAPFNGVLGLRQVSEGSWVSPATPLITIQDVSALKIDFQIPEKHASSIHKGGTFQVIVDGQAHPFVGEIVATEPSVNLESRSLSVRGVVRASEGLVPGTFAKVELPLVVKEALLVPAIAIIPGVEGRGVFVAREGKAHLVPVELGPRGPERVQVLSGLKSGDAVIVSNLLRLRDGVAIQVEKTTQTETKNP